MTLTVDQFNKISTKEDHKILDKKVYNISKNINILVTSMDHIVKKLDIIETEITSKQVDYERFEKLISRLAAHIGLKLLRV